MSGLKQGKLAVYNSNNCLIAPVQVELDTALVEDLSNEVLKKIHQSTNKPLGVVIDLSGVEIIDLVLADFLVKLAKMIQLLGVCCVISGLKAAQASSLASLNFSATGAVFLRTLEQGISYLQGRSCGT